MLRFFSFPGFLEAICLSFVLASTGCSSSVSTELERAAALSSPAQALVVIRQASHDYCRGAFFPNECVAPDELIAAEKKYFEAAARAGDGGVLSELFLAQNPAWLPLQEELKATLLETAKTTNTAQVLVAAANLYGNDWIMAVDRLQQTRLLKRAWEQGDKDAAGYVADVYAGLKDYENAYLWSLRCTQPCSRIRGHERTFRQIKLEDLARHLSSEQILRLQREASAAT